MDAVPVPYPLRFVYAFGDLTSLKREPRKVVPASTQEGPAHHALGTTTTGRAALRGQHGQALVRARSGARSDRRPPPTSRRCASSAPKDDSALLARTTRSNAARTAASPLEPRCYLPRALSVGGSARSCGGRHGVSGAHSFAARRPVASSDAGRGAERAVQPPRSRAAPVTRSAAPELPSVARSWLSDCRLSRYEPAAGGVISASKTPVPTGRAGALS
jgi:hypothetical protein